MHERKEYGRAREASYLYKTGTLKTVAYAMHDNQRAYEPTWAKGKIGCGLGRALSESGRSNRIFRNR